MKYTEDEINRLKTKSCVEYLESRGYLPKNSHGRTYKYLAPWRKESIPSVHVYKATNSFVDFGDRSIGGSVIQLCMAVEGVGFARACEILNGKELPQRSILPDRVEESPIKILYTCNIISAWLIQYLAKRCIPLDIARRFCKQARIELKNDKNIPYRKTCIAWKNDRNGFDFRNRNTKIGCSPKYITTIQKGRKDLYLFEGMFDFMAFVACGRLLDATCVVLNSIVFVGYIDFGIYDTVHYLCDNDVSGNSWFEKIEHPNKKDERDFFKPYKDVSEWWEAKCTNKNTLYQKELMQML